MKKLLSWETSKLSLAGKINLAQSVFFTIPSYIMQAMHITVSIVLRFIECVVILYGKVWEKERNYILSLERPLSNPKTAVV